MDFYDPGTGQFERPSKDGILSAVKAIETRYNGYRFRSRTEARWAVLLDALEIKYEYEKEGFDLICGPYLPDFWLPYSKDITKHLPTLVGGGVWLEVKCTEPTQHELTRLLHLSIETKQPGTLVCGPPWNCKHYHTYPTGGFEWWPVDDRDEVDVIIDIFVGELFGNIGLISEALEKAKSARFEFGEKP
jgi:hypothetical protein